MCPYGQKLSDEWAMVAFKKHAPAKERARLMRHVNQCAQCTKYYEDNIFSRIYHKQAERVTA